MSSRYADARAELDQSQVETSLARTEAYYWQGRAERAEAVRDDSRPPPFEQWPLSADRVYPDKWGPIEVVVQRSDGRTRDVFATGWHVSEGVLNLLYEDSTRIAYAAGAWLTVSYADGGC